VLVARARARARANLTWLQIDAVRGAVMCVAIYPHCRKKWRWSGDCLLCLCEVRSYCSGFGVWGSAIGVLWLGAMPAVRPCTTPRIWYGNLTLRSGVNLFGLLDCGHRTPIPIPKHRKTILSPSLSLSLSLNLSLSCRLRLRLVWSKVCTSLIANSMDTHNRFCILK